MVERDDLVARIAAAHAAARAGHGSIVAVSGEAGAGKTSLVRAAFPGRTAAWGFCEPLSTPRPLGPFRDISRIIWGGRADHDLRETLLDWMGGEPIPLVVEDAHWIDDASAELLRFLGRRIEFSRGLVVVTFRDELAPAHPLQSFFGDLASARTVERIVLAPLSADAVAQLTGRAQDVENIYQLTKGNAFLVVELAQASGRRISPTLADEVASRVGRLSDPSRHLVEMLSVIPGRTDTRLLAEDWRHLDEAVVAAILEADDTHVEFRHELVRLTIEDGLHPARKASLHAEVLERLIGLGDTEPAVIAFHAHHAHAVRTAFDAEQAAGDRAVETRSHRAAAEHFSRAVEGAPAGTGPSALALVLIRLAEAEFLAGRGAQALAAANRALALCPPGTDVRVRGTALSWLSRTTPAEAASHAFAQQAVDLLEPLGPTRELAAALAHLALNRMVARALPEARRLARRSVELAEQLGDTPSLVSALQALGCAELLDGGSPSAQHLHRAIELARDGRLHAQLGQAHANLVSATGEARWYAESAKAAEEALAYFVAQDLDLHADYARAWQARCLFEQGRWSQATTSVDAILGAPSSPGGIAAIVAHTVRGRIRARRGDPDVWSPLDHAKRIADTTQSLQRIAPVAAARAEALWLSGRTDDGRSGLIEAYELALARANPWAIGELGLWMWRHRLTDQIPPMAAKPYLLQVQGAFTEAGDLWTDLGCPYEAAEAWSDSDDPVTVRRALDSFTELGAAPGRQRAARQLRRLGVLRIPRGPRTTTAADPAGLTAREREILSWIRGGYTDSEIAGRLHLSVKTVEHHVSAVLRKTNSRSRRQLQVRGDSNET